MVFFDAGQQETKLFFSFLLRLFGNDSWENKYFFLADKVS